MRDATMVDCETRSIETRLSSKLATAALARGWQGEKQRKLNALSCDDPASSDGIKHGWSFAQSTVFADGSTFSIKAACE